MHRLRPAFVWAVWAGMTVAAGLFVARYGGRIPVQDDFFYLGLRLDPSPPSATTLWEQLNEHRLPLPRLFTWGVARVLGLGWLGEGTAGFTLVAHGPRARCGSKELRRSWRN